VWGGEAEVVGEEGAPGNGGVEGVENLVKRLLFGGVQRRLLVGEREEGGCEEKRKEYGQDSHLLVGMFCFVLF